MFKNLSPIQEPLLMDNEMDFGKNALDLDLESDFNVNMNDGFDCPTSSTKSDNFSSTEIKDTPGILTGDFFTNDIDLEKNEDFKIPVDGDSNGQHTLKVDKTRSISTSKESTEKQIEELESSITQTLHLKINDIVNVFIFKGLQKEILGKFEPLGSGCKRHSKEIKQKSQKKIRCVKERHS